ncbi:MAG: ABC transporter ATP-binding protein [Acidimicrobiia bacterium]
MNPIVTDGVSRAYGDELALDRLTIEVAPGEIHAIVGLNGAGKTTLMRILMGMIRPDSGRALLHGSDVIEVPGRTWADVGHMIESPFGYPELTVVENISAAAKLRGIPSGDVAAAADSVVKRFELGRWADRRARALSMGNRQRLGLACALVHTPGVIVLDEPSNSLDPAGVVLVRDLMRHEAAEGAAILVSSHHLDELARVAHRISVLHRGRLIGNIDPDGFDLERRFFELVHGAETSVGEGVHRA